MRTENWKTIKKLLNEVLPLDRAERGKFFEKFKVNGEIRREVESLLAFEEESEDLMRLSAVEFLKDFIDADENTLIGQNIGVFRIVRELGQGGMGAVYLAERADGKFQQKVALKLLKREMNTAALRRRFQTEREILESLEHPNIARLLNAGMTDDKIPYIAMEYIEGLPINDYCNKNGLNLNQRLDLFREVCSAVDFAHRNLIVHRDLKPSNILVNEDGVPKLLDFGISKILSEEIENADSATITKLGVMTPSYASPEQIQSKSVTTATDVYSLGVILYELLSGHRPFETKEDNLKEIYKAIIEIDPPLPSSMVDTISKQFKEITEAKTAIQSNDEPKSFLEEPQTENKQTKANKTLLTNPHQVNLNSNSIRGDLDNIVLKALRKEPERRYSSAENFAEDIKRHLRGLPVSARPNTFSYRAEKFVKRNKASVFAAGLILLAIIGGIIATLWQARAAQAEREVAQAEKAKAERRFNDVRQLANSFLFDLAPKIEKLPGSTPAREELISLALEYLDSLSKEASGDLQLQRELAMAYEKVGDLQGNQASSNLGDTQAAAKSYEKAFNIRQKLYNQNPNDLTAMSDMASSFARMSEIKMQIGTTEEVKEFFDKSLALRKEIVRRNPNDFEARKNLAIALRGKGRMLYTDARYKEAVKQYDLATNAYEKLLREQPENLEIAENLAYMYVDYGEAYGWDNDLEAAEIALKKALDLLIPLAEKYPNNQSLQRSLQLAYAKKASSTIETEDYEKAIYEYGKAAEIAEIFLKADPQNFRARWDVVITKKDLADAYGYAGKHQKSLDILKNVIKKAEEISKGDRNNPKTLYEIAVIQLKIGEAYAELKDFEAALDILKQSKENFQTVVELDPKYKFAIRTIHLTTLTIADVYAKFAEKRNDKELYRKALENYQSAFKGFTEMKSKGEIGEYDNKLFPEIEAKIKKVKSKSGK